MVNWNYLETFVVLSEKLSFSETARLLATSQPVVSRQIRLLEHELGYTLFLRSTKRVVLTPEGLALKGRLGPLVEEIRKVLLEKQADQKLLSGALRIGSMYEGGQTILFPHLADFLELHPSLQIHTSFMSSAEACDEILKGSLDLGFVHAVKESKSLVAFPLTEDTPVLVTEKRTAKKWRELSQLQLVTYRQNDPYSKSLVEERLSKADRKKLQITSSVNSHAMMIELVCRQKAFAVIPLSSAKAALDDGRIEVLLEGKTHKLYVIAHESGLADKRKKALIEFLRARF